ncbi:MAG TPA: hypothetical protein VMB81_02185 [Candidatus Sulfotelmatobacter sp.]|nr:hypothetical protein [Candidatus Sulfotelmatobacter sp.]
MTPETILDLAKQQGLLITPARAKELADGVGSVLAGVNRVPVAFEAEPELFHAVLEELAQR